MSSLYDLAVFRAVAEAGGFSGAARRLGVTTAGTSKSVGRLEERLGVRLFTRTTRRVVPTAEGARFLGRVRDVLDALAEAEEEARSGAVELAGPVRVEMAASLGRLVVTPLLLEFHRAHPAVELDLRYEDAVSDLVGADVDVAVRFGELADSTLHARRVRGTRFVTCASPDYLARRGTPATPDELAAHACATYVYRGSRQAFRWRFDEGGERRFVDVPRGLSVDDPIVHHRIALEGLAVVQDLDFHLEPMLADGSLVEVLGRCSAAGPPVSIVYPGGRYRPARVRALVEHLAAGLTERPAGDSESRR